MEGAQVPREYMKISATYFMASSNMYCMVCTLHLHVSVHCVYLRRITYVWLLCMHIQRDVPHLEQCLQMYIQTYAEIVSHGKHCLWCLVSCNCTVKLSLSLLCLSARKLSTSFLSAYFYDCIVLISGCGVFSVLSWLFRHYPKYRNAWTHFTYWAIAPMLH